jgi:hypothetical protein
MFNQVAINLPSVSSGPSLERAAGSGNSGRSYTPECGNLPANRSTAATPALLDRAADYDIPRLWCEFDVTGKPLAIFRALTDGERDVLQRRRVELELGCAPFTPAEQDQVADAVLAMLDGFRSLRNQDMENAAMSAQGLCRLLAPYPLWAIERGCSAIHGGDAVLDGERLSKKYPPNDAEIRSVVAEIVKPYLDLRDRTVALLAAPVKLAAVEVPRPTAAEITEKYGASYGLAAGAAGPAPPRTVPKIRPCAPGEIEQLAARLKPDAE